MPLYEYRCGGCGERFEVLQRMGEGAGSLACPRCGAARPERQLSTFAAATHGGATASAADACSQGSACCRVSSGFS